MCIITLVVPKKTVEQSSPWGECIKAFLNCLGFIKLKHGSLKNPCDSNPDYIYLLQITSEHDDGSTDNSHCVVIYDGQVFDINHEDPLPLTKIDLCCVGSDWT